MGTRCSSTSSCAMRRCRPPTSRALCGSTTRFEPTSPTWMQRRGGSSRSSVSSGRPSRKMRPPTPATWTRASSGARWPCSASRASSARAVRGCQMPSSRFTTACERRSSRTSNPATQRELHERIAATLEASRAGDHEVLAVHWRAAGHAQRACEHLIVAAEQASRALAFNRAARLYAGALGLLSPSDVERRCELLEARGDALASSGEGALAAEEYERAADDATGGRALDLRRRAAEQLLRCGVAERGLAALRAVLAAVGMRVPETFLAAIVQLLFYRLLVRLRGLGFRARDEREIPGSRAHADRRLLVGFARAQLHRLVQGGRLPVASPPLGARGR